MGWIESAAVALLGSSTISSSFMGFGGKKPTDSTTMDPSNRSLSDSFSITPSTPPSSIASVDSTSSKIVNPGQFFKYGHPGPHIDFDFRQEYISAFDRRMRNPAYVIEHITPESLVRNGTVDRKKSVFMENEAIPLKFRGRLADYFRSGYDRGHMAPAANAKFSQAAMDETFYLTNMAPQVGEGFNRDCKRFEVFDSYCIFF